MAASHDSFFHSETENPVETADFENLVIATSPDSWSWQHFLDRVSVVWSQAILSLSEQERKETAILAGRFPNNTFLDEMYAKMGAKTHVHNRIKVTAKNLIFSCRAPLIHPYSTQRITELFGIDIYQVPINKRKIVLYMTRNEDAVNGGRQILNEDELLGNIRRLLRERNKGEELAIFDRRKFKTVSEIMLYFSQNVLGIIGPHGSAFHNARFASAGTFVLEFMPTGRFQSCFWEQSRLMDQNYAVYMAESIGDYHDMQIVGIPKLMNLINRELGKPFERNTNLARTYPWVIDE